MEHEWVLHTAICPVRLGRQSAGHLLYAHASCISRLTQSYCGLVEDTMPKATNVPAITPGIQQCSTNQREITSSSRGRAGCNSRIRHARLMCGYRQVTVSFKHWPWTTVKRAYCLGTLTCEWTLAQSACNYAQTVVTCYSAYLSLYCSVSFHCSRPHLPTLMIHIPWRTATAAH